jgi:hypothetical protein
MDLDKKQGDDTKGLHLDAIHEHEHSSEPLAFVQCRYGTNGTAPDRLVSTHRVLLFASACVDLILEQ